MPGCTVVLRSGKRDPGSFGMVPLVGLVVLSRLASVWWDVKDIDKFRLMESSQLDLKAVKMYASHWFIVCVAPGWIVFV